MNGAWLALGAPVALAVASAVRHRGSRAEVQGQVQKPAKLKVPTEAEVVALVEKLDAVRESSHHISRRMNEDEDWYQFNIKAHDMGVSDEMIEAVGNETAYQWLYERAHDEIDHFLDWIREDRYPWIGKKWHTAGRSGGWLLLQDDEAARESLRSWEGWERPFLRITGVRLPKPDAAKEMAAAYVLAQKRLPELADLEREIEKMVTGFEAYTKDPEFWEPILESSARSKRAAAKARKALKRKHDG